MRFPGLLSNRPLNRNVDTTNASSQLNSNETFRATSSRRLRESINISWFWKKKCDQIFCLVRRKKAALVWRNPMGYARPSNSSIIDFLSQVYSRFAVRATMSLIFDLRKIGIKWNSVSFFSATQLEPQNTEKKKMAAKRTLWWKKPFFVTLLFFKSSFGFVKSLFKDIWRIF